MKHVMVTGILEVEDDEYDPNHEMGLTTEAYERYSDELGLDDLKFTRVDE